MQETIGAPHQPPSLQPVGPAPHTGFMSQHPTQRQQPMFSGPLRVLSNFDTTPFHVPALGATVKSSEHAFNAFKTLDPVERQWVLDANTPAQAKHRGQKVTLRPGWNEGVRVRAMQSSLLAKFSLPSLREALDHTGHQMLVETNTWHDNFWGDCTGHGRTPCRPDCALPGTNMLGQLLMALRCRNL